MGGGGLYLRTLNGSTRLETGTLRHQHWMLPCDSLTLELRSRRTTPKSPIINVRSEYARFPIYGRIHDKFTVAFEGVTWT